MNDAAYEHMRTIQERHWWWRGLAVLYRSTLHKFLPKGQPHRIIDVGCGFGANLPLLSEFGDVVGVDVSLDALRTIGKRPTLGLVQARADALPFRPGSFDAVALLAVVEHVEEDDRVLAEAHRVARPGAIQILLTSAFMLLWSHHDDANRHYRRYRAAHLDSLQQSAGWRVVISSYVNSFVFPGVVAIRVLQRLLRIVPAGAYDMGPDLWPLGLVLEQFLRLETWLILRRGRLPVGVDLFTVARREG